MEDPGIKSLVLQTLKKAGIKIPEALPAYESDPFIISDATKIRMERALNKAVRKSKTRE